MFKYGEEIDWKDFLNRDFSCDIETTELKNGNIYAVGFSDGNNGVVLIPGFENDTEIIIELLTRTLLNPQFEYQIIFHNIFFDLPYLIHCFFENRKIKSTACFAPRLRDTLIFSRYLFSTSYLDHIDVRKRSAYSLKYLSFFHGIDLSHEAYDEIVQGKRIEYVDVKVIADYCFKDCLNTFKLHEKLTNISVAEGTFDYFFHHHLSHALLNVLHMLLNGIPVNARKLEDSLNILENLAELFKNEIYDTVGEVFNIFSSIDLFKIVFKKDAFKSIYGKKLRKPFVTDKGRVKLDTSTLKILRDECLNPLLMDKIIFVLEVNNALISMRALKDHLYKVEESYKIYPNQSASAKSTRLKCNNPPVHGFSKIVFKHTDSNFLKKITNDLNLESFSVRHFLSAPNDYRVLSMDAKSIDLVNLAELANLESWKEIFSWNGDNHFEIFRLGNPLAFEICFKAWGGLNIGRIIKIGIKDSYPFLKFFSGGAEQIVELSIEQFKELEKYRAAAKQTNLAIPYMLGANQLAKKISEVTEEENSEKESRERLNSYYKYMPEIRLLHDKIANTLYDQGHVRAIINGVEFGIRLYSNTFMRMNNNLLLSDMYEFVIYQKGANYYVRTRGWVKHKQMFEESHILESEIVRSLKYVESEFGFYFRSIEELIRLPDNIFSKNLIKKSKTRVRKKNEDDQKEVSDYVYDVLERSCLIDEHINSVMRNPVPSFSEIEVANSLLKNSYAFISEKKILFHRVKESDHRSYFKHYRPLISETKKLFPTYIQSVSTACVAKVLTDVRVFIESRNLKSYVFLSVHDSIDIMVHKEEEELIKSFVQSEEARASFIPITWEVKDFCEHHT